MVGDTGDWEQHEGDTDMPEYAVGYNKGWDDGTKQARAEVLAACRAVLYERAKKYRSVGELEMERATIACTEIVRNVQRAAKALEELLREEREKYSAALSNLVDAIECVHSDPEYKSVWTLHHIHGGKYKGPGYGEELERARAILEKG